jgi:hypothetical protein
LADMDLNDSKADLKEYSFWDATDQFAIVVCV